ncbi:MAG: phospholipase D family protein [Acidobacteriota bacterium]|nr:phospholipase D family protein [Acidobacteriota bacterium]
MAAVLRDASRIQLATAFAHKSGWEYFDREVFSNKAEVSLLAGLEFLQTEPALLKRWLELKIEKGNRIEAKLASNQTFFHPKVLIVTCDNKRSAFAIVGSGNLSQGGLRMNTECSLFIDDANLIGELSGWFRDQFEAVSATSLTAEVIKAYEPIYRKNRQRLNNIRKDQRDASKKMSDIGQPTMTLWKDAVRDAKIYLKSSRYEKEYRMRHEAAERILRVLKKEDNYTFDKNGWDEFYGIRPLGGLDHRYRDIVFRQQGRLKKALRALTDNGEKALPMVLDPEGSLHVAGLGLNTVSKIMAAHDPKTWPVFNSRVAAVLKNFGYGSPRTGKGRKYIAYKNAMAKFMADSGAPDTIALDGFFYSYSELLAR